ncbi:MAG: RIP metalloprotease RseP [Parvibaculaceae bacterium]|nr:RIP metalloprotease RseP [Parvibaculaceae bacterium]
MEFLTGIFGAGWGALSYIVPFIFVLTIVVFFHELGHFLVGRWCGIHAEVFSIGMGREIYGRTDKRGTRWKISLLPIGGYVKFRGDTNAASVSSAQPSEDTAPLEGTYHGATVGRRSATAVAGPVANFMLSTVVFALIFMFVGRTIILPSVDDVQPGSAAERAGFMVGDIVLDINGDAINSFADMQRIVSISPLQELSVTVRRGDVTQMLKATPDEVVREDGFGGTQKLGVLGIRRSPQPTEIKVERYDPMTALWMGAGETWFVLERTVDYLIGMVAGREDPSQLRGPLGIADITGQVAQISFASLVSLIALLSVSIGLLNLLPVPMLDGGHLLFYAIEAIKGSPLGEQAQEIGFRIGLALVMMLAVFATWNDLQHLQVVSFFSELLS